MNKVAIEAATFFNICIIRAAAGSIQKVVRGFVSRANFQYMVRAKGLMHRMWWRIRLWLACARRRIAAR